VENFLYLGHSSHSGYTSNCRQHPAGEQRKRHTSNKRQIRELKCIARSVFARRVDAGSGALREEIVEKKKRQTRGAVLELVGLAAQIAGCSRSMVYKVIEGSARSERVRRAIQAAKNQLEAAA